MKRFAIALTLLLAASVAHAVVTPTCATGFVPVNGFCIVVSLTVSAPAGGVITSDAAATINCGTQCTQTFSAVATVHLHATPAPGYAAAAWGGACAGTAAASDCTVTVDSAKSVSKVFDRKVMISGKCNAYEVCGTATMCLYWDQYGPLLHACGTNDANAQILWTAGGNLKKPGGFLTYGATTPTDACFCAYTSGLTGIEVATNSGGTACQAAACVWAYDPATGSIHNNLDPARSLTFGGKVNFVYNQIYYVNSVNKVNWMVTTAP